MLYFLVNLTNIDIIIYIIFIIIYVITYIVYAFMYTSSIHLYTYIKCISINIYNLWHLYGEIVHFLKWMSTS